MPLENNICARCKNIIHCALYPLCPFIYFEQHTMSFIKYSDNANMERPFNLETIMNKFVCM